MHECSFCNICMIRGKCKFMENKEGPKRILEGLLEKIIQSLFFIFSIIKIFLRNSDEFKCKINKINEY